MAHFAKLGLNNVVEQVLVVNNVDTMTPQGVEDENVGIAFLTKLTGHSTWKQTSYNSKFRKNYAGIGFMYDAGRDAFIPPKPFESWVLDENTCSWNPPIPYPGGRDERYNWNESTRSWDKV